MALVYHPDKIGREPTEQDTGLWLLVQRGLEQLTDPKKRTRYDSTLPCDDDLPEKGDWKTDEEFYKMWDDVFVRNSMWSTKRPSPALGNKDTPIAEVRAFYKYWDNFETWREFCQHDEHDEDAIEQAKERTEKRWMQNENKRIRAKYDKEERIRLIKMTETCYQNDPRIMLELAALEEEKQKVKQAKKDFKAAQAYEKDRVQREADEKAAAEALLIAGAEVKAKAEARIVGILFRTQVKILIELCKIKMSGTTYDKFWVESIQKRLTTIEKIQPVVDSLEQAESQQEFINFVTTYMMSESDRAKVQSNATVVETAAAEQDGWNDEEIAQLLQGLQKYPVGTPNRWESLVAMVGTKNQKEVIKKCGDLGNKKQVEADERKAKEAQVKAIAEMKAVMKAEEVKQIEKAQGIVSAKPEEKVQAKQENGPTTATADSQKK